MISIVAYNELMIWYDLISYIHGWVNTGIQLLIYLCADGLVMVTDHAQSKRCKVSLWEVVKDEM